MAVRNDAVEVSVDGERLRGTLVSPGMLLPGFLFLQGWGSTYDQDLVRAREIAALGCVCLTFEARGVAQDDPRHGSVTRENNLRDVLAAYDTLAERAGVDPHAIGVVGSSYGGYLAAIISALRPIRWLALRAPALYRDEDWDAPKALLDRKVLAAYRLGVVAAETNRALRACATYAGDVLLVQSENDDIVPPPVTVNYRAAFRHTHSLTFRMIRGADHGLSDVPSQQAYTSLLVNWSREMILGAREGGAPPGTPTHAAPAPQREPSTP